MESRLFRWLNREIDNTEVLRPNGDMFLTEQRTVQYAVGSCEVKSSNNEGAMGTHEDLYRLAIFCKNAMDKGQIKAFMAIQVVDLAPFMMRMDQLKQVSTLDAADDMESTLAFYF
ncbi:hypothetical protein RMCBS344292_14359 [Rhizopus microsporus]|nr:hypothetical protein RMCBS344292_14359 [Rhizopus microsporus]